MTTKQKNKWKERTIALIMVCLVIIGIFIFQTINEIPTDLKLCQAVEGVPAFISVINKEVIFSGYHGIPEPGVIDALINEEIAFVYSTGCPYCAKQIEAFGDEWIKYQEAGLTVDCARLK